MVSLEWYRTFKAVYKHKNYSRAAKELFMSQPAVSNQISMLEAAVGHKLFYRKSKGVEPTENAKFLNNLIIDALDKLEAVEAFYNKRAAKESQFFSLGMSPHAYHALFSGKLPAIGQHISFQFEESSQVLFDLVNERKLDYAIIDKEVNTFDTLTAPIFQTSMCVVAHPHVDLQPVAQSIAQHDFTEIEAWLENQVWFSHSATNHYIKLFWLHCFNKQRPRIFTNYTIPNSFLMLNELCKTPGVAIALQHEVNHFVEASRLQQVWAPENAPEVRYFLIAHKKKQAHFDSILTGLTQ
ncbi:LysR family transcriptional regulator [uncultured Microscilla sp.]|uniref:LysR family transcriptional regulator n=1 Tax=uncultured Microscilla sp. TaxID=432653 RepID=UPI00263309E3|nr:LysR family transcriptional regulator [uncultured Microscilla sp.]